MDPRPEPQRDLEAVAFGLALGYFGAYQLFKLPVVLPLLLETYGYDRALAGGFMSVYSLAGLLISVWVGRRVGTHGPLALVGGALAVTVAGSLLTLAAPQVGLVVLAGRGLEGLGFAVFAMVGPVLANAAAPRKHLPVVIGLTAAWIPIGQLAAALLAPPAIALSTWRSLWYAGIAGAGLLAAWLLRLRRRDRRPGAAPVRPSPDGALDPRERRAMVLCGAVFMLWSGQYFAFMTWLPQYLVDSFAVDVTGALIGYVLPVVFVMAFNVLTGFALRAGWSLGRLMSSALVSQALVWWCIPLATSPVPGAAALVVYGVGAGIVPACLFAMPSAVLGRQDATARAFGIMMTGRNLGVLIGPVLVAQVFKLSGDWALSSTTFAVLTTLCTGLGLLLARRTPRRGG